MRFNRAVAMINGARRHATVDTRSVPPTRRWPRSRYRPACGGRHRHAQQQQTSIEDDEPPAVRDCLGGRFCPRRPNFDHRAARRQVHSDPRPFAGCFTTLYPKLSEVRIIGARLLPNCGALIREGQRWWGYYLPDYLASRPEVPRLLADQARADTICSIQPAGELRRVHLLLAGTFSGAGTMGPLATKTAPRPKRRLGIDGTHQATRACAEHAKGLIARVERVQSALQ